MKPWDQFRKYAGFTEPDHFWGCIYANKKAKSTWYDSAARLETALYLSYKDMGLDEKFIDELEAQTVEVQLAFLAGASREIVHGSLLKIRYERGELE